MSDIGASWSTETIYLIGIRLAFALFLIGLAIFVTSLHVQRDVDISSVEGDILLSRLYYSNDCFAVKDTRVHPGVIDYKQFTQEKLTNCLYGPIFVEAKLAQHDTTISNDADAYKAYAQLCAQKTERYQCASKAVPVLVTNGKYPTDTLIMHIIIPQNPNQLITLQP